MTSFLTNEKNTKNFVTQSKLFCFHFWIFWAGKNTKNLCGDTQSEMSLYAYNSGPFELVAQVQLKERVSTNDLNNKITASEVSIIDIKCWNNNTQ